MLKLARYLKPYTWLCLLVVLFVLIQVACTLRLPREMSDIVNYGIIQRGIPGNMQTDASVAAQVAEAVRTAGASITDLQRSYFMEKGALMLAITLVAGCAAVCAGFFASRISAAVARDLRRDIFSKIENFSLTEFDRFSTASLIIRSTNDIQQVQQMTFFLLRLATMAPATAIWALFLMLQTDASLAWILGITLPLLLLTIGILIYFGMPVFRSIQAKTDHLNLVAREGLTGVRVIRAFDREPMQQARFAEANDDLAETTIKVNRMMVTMMPVMQLLMQFTTIAIIWFGAHLINDMTMRLGDMMAFLQYAMQILFSVMMLSMIFIMYPRASVSGERINEVLDTEPVIEDPPRALGSATARPSVQFRDVSFKFAGSEEHAVCGIDFTSESDTITAIIGSTGSGKSTILNLIVRLYDVTSGAVLVNGVDVREMSQHYLHELIGYIPQRAVLFDGTIAENIRFGREDASEEEIEAALELAQAFDFVSELDEGVDSFVAQGGTNFSGGQKQRLAIARAIVKDPQIFLFDDSFSALDLKTDAALRAALAPMLRKAVTIIVAQRISTIVDADQILVMDEGRIAGRGTHDELMRDCRIYREIAQSQMTDEELAEQGFERPDIVTPLDEDIAEIEAEACVDYTLEHEPGVSPGEKTCEAEPSVVPEAQHHDDDAIDEDARVGDLLDDELLADDLDEDIELIGDEWMQL
jgi:ATP-binding cassette subfamily B protein